MPTSLPSRAGETARLAALRRYAPTDQDAAVDAGAIARLAAMLCRAPIAAVSLVDATHQRILASHGACLTTTPREVALCEHAIRAAGVVEVPDARLAPDVADAAMVTGAPHAIFYAGAPLLAPGGEPIGAVCVMDRQPRVLTAAEREGLQLLAQQMMGQLEQARSLAALRVLDGERVAHLERLQRSADATAHHEQRLALVMQAVDAGVWDWDLATGEVHFSPRFAELFELASDGPLPVEDLFSTLDDRELEELHTRFGELFSGRVERLWHEFTVRTAGGGPRWLRFRGHVTTREADGSPRRAVGLVVDITSDRRRDEQQRAAQKLDTLGGLAAGIAHEINTPLQVVSHNLDYLASQCDHVVTTLGQRIDDPALRTLHDDVSGAIAESIDGLDRVTHIVRALKEFSHQGGTAARERVDVNRMIEHAIALTRHEWRFVASFERDLAPGLPAVPAAAYECGQLLVNLIVNAAHAVLAVTAPGQKGRIGVATRSDGHQIEIRVWDTGTGIADDIRDRVFEPFFTTKRVGLGTGQGLATARAIVERHGGTIGFDTEVGRGTTFVVRLPVSPDAAQAA